MTAFVVMGMHKSGTTLVSEALHQSGIPMVDDARRSRHYDSGEKFERRPFQAINRQLLGCRDDRSLDIELEAGLRDSEPLARRAAELIAEQDTAHDEWGFKDPRTTLTYPFWRPLLPHHAIIVVYRDPLCVWAHYRKRTSGCVYLERVFSHWTAYNSSALEHITSTTAPSLVVGLRALLEGQRQWLRLQSFVGRALTDVRNHELIRSSDVESVDLAVPQRARLLMDRLDGLAHGQGAEG